MGGEGGRERNCQLQDLTHSYPKHLNYELECMLPFPFPLSALYGTSGILDVEGASVCLLENEKEGGKKRKRKQERRRKEYTGWLNL